MNKLETVITQQPSFPEVNKNKLLDVKDKKIWQVI